MMSFSQVLRHILLILIVSTLLVFLAMMYSKDKAFSKVFHVFNSDKEILKRAKELNNVRLNKARTYFAPFNVTDKKTLGSNKTSIYQGLYSPTPEIVTVIVTVNRKAYDSSRLGYVLQTLAATHSLFIHDETFPLKTLIICNVDLDPVSYTDISFLRSYIPIVERYGVASIPVSFNASRKSLYENRVYNSKYDKETVDYMYCLEAGYSLGAKYVLLMEDDALPRSDTLMVLRDKIDYLNRKKGGRYSYIKLYYPQRWQGYSYDISRIIEIVSIGCVGAGIAVLSHYLMCSSKSYLVQLVYFFYGAWLFVTIAMIIGRQNVYEMYRISKYLYTLKDSPGCCTQAMLYTRQFIPQLVDFLSFKRKHLHTDLAIYNFTNTTGIPAYQVEPNLFYHVGMYTSLSSDRHKNAEEFMFGGL